MFIFLGFLAILIAILLILLVVIQNSKGGGLSGAFGSGNLTNVIGTRRATQDIEKLTWYAAGGLMLVCFLATISMGSGKAAAEENFGNLTENVYQGQGAGVSAGQSDGAGTQP